MSDVETIKWYEALWHAVRHRDAAYYPLLPESERTKAEDKNRYIFDAIKEAFEGLEDKASDPNDTKRLDAVLECARESLEEVKSLTEYQDQKATRMLTIIAFLSALGGALFAKFLDSYPLAQYLWGTRPTVAGSLIVSAYLAFFLFSASAIAVALVVFHATETRFRWPSEAQAKEPSSRLFFRGIITSLPDRWARVFVSGDKNSRTFVDERSLKLAYAKDYVGETYLVAAKVGDKLRYLQAAHAILRFSIAMLFVWVLLSIVSTIPAHKRENSPPPAVQPAAKCDQAPRVTNIISCPVLPQRHDTTRSANRNKTANQAAMQH